MPSVSGDLNLPFEGMACNLSEQIEEHAYHTYDEFLSNHKTSLLLEKPPEIAVKYYRDREIANLYDVFINVLDDEFEVQDQSGFRHSGPSL